MKKILVIGSSCVDVTINVHHMPVLEEDINPYGQELSLGGCAHNVSNMLRLMNVPYTLLSPVGTGVYGDFVRNCLERENVPVIVEHQDENGCCYCIVDADGNRTFMAVHGTEYKFYPEDFNKITPEEYDFVYVCGLEIEEDTGENILNFLKANRHMQVVYAPSARISVIPMEKHLAVLQLHPIIHLNYREAKAFLKINTDIRSCAEKLYKITGKPVIITDGGNGCAAFDDTGFHWVEGLKANVIDTNGAGDCHIGTVMAMLAKGADLVEALQKAVEVSARLVEIKGACFSNEKYENIFMKE